MLNRSHHLFKKSVNHRSFSTGSNVILTSDTVNELYRAQDHTNLFSLMTFTLGVFASIQPRELQSQVVVQHQKATQLVGTTECKKTAIKLAETWNHDALLIIDPNLIRKYLVDVKQTVRLTGTGFYTKMNEFEHSTTLLPICAVKDIEFLSDGNKTSNPFYLPASLSGKHFESIYKEHLKLLQNLFSHGKQMSNAERQKALNIVFNLYAELYEQQFGKNENPYTMQISDLIQFINNPKFNAIFDGLDPNTNLLDTLTSQGDALFMQNVRYTRLLGNEHTEKLMMESMKDYERNSYSFD